MIGAEGDEVALGVFEREIDRCSRLALGITTLPPLYSAAPSMESMFGTLKKTMVPVLSSTLNALVMAVLALNLKATTAGSGGGLENR